MSTLTLCKRAASVTVVLAIAFALGCDHSPPTELLNEDTECEGVVTVVTDTTPREELTPSRIVADLARADGVVIVAVKEACAHRGMSSDGSQIIPLEAALAAQGMIEVSFPDLEVLRSVERPSNTFTAVIPASESFVANLQKHPNVDYLVPNYRDGVVLGGGW
jgi:hypothetical protein